MTVVALVRHIKYAHVVLLYVVLIFLKVVGRRLTVGEQMQVKGGERDRARLPTELLFSNICYCRLCWQWRSLRLLENSPAWNFCFHISLCFWLSEFVRRELMKICGYCSDVALLKYWGKTEVCIKSLSRALLSLKSGLQKSPLQNTSFFFFC